MQCKDRKGTLISSNDAQDKLIKRLYCSKPGRSLLSILTKRSVSELGGFFLKTGLSRTLIPSFVRKHGIDLSDYVGAPYASYNDFFIRKIKKSARPIDFVREHLISPCDSKLTVHKIERNGIFLIKDCKYNFFSLTKNRYLQNKFEGGLLLLFRLSVDDYHRYCYIDDGYKSKTVKIKGCFHTVNPIAGNHYPIYRENQREYCILETENFGDVMMMEVGAMMVGKIVNYHGERRIKRGMEKGRFEFGGSTVLLAFQKNRVRIDPDIIKNSMQNIETKVRLGEKIGIKDGKEA